MKKLLVLVFAIISMASLVSCDCSHCMQKGQVWTAYPTGKPTQDSIMFLILDIKKDKDNNQWVQVENITNGGTSLENYSKFRNWVDHKVCDTFNGEKPYVKDMKIDSLSVETSAPVENVSDEWKDVIDEFKTTEEYKNCGSQYNATLIKWLSENYYKPRKRN